MARLAVKMETPFKNSDGEMRYVTQISDTDTGKLIATVFAADDATNELNAMQIEKLLTYIAAN
jgi:hypothetical protein